MIIGIDVGYGYTKAYTKVGHIEQKTVFPSHVAELTEESGFEQFDCVSLGGQRYLVGEAVTQAGYSPVETVTTEFVGSNYYIALLGKAIADFAPTDDVIVVTGLPPAMFSQENIYQLKKALKEQIPIVTKDTRKYAVAIKDVLFVPQGVGGYIAAMNDTDISTKRAVAVFDLGYHTLDVVIIKDYKYAYHESGSTFLGVKAFYDEIRNRILRQYSINVSDEVIERMLRSGEEGFTHFGRVYSVSVKDILEQYKKRLINYLQVYETKVNTPIEACLLCGGGADILLNIDKGQNLSRQIIRDPQMANARGYWIFGIKKLKGF